ncbi:MAG: alpha/beta hydrolase-fold protein [Chitinophagales bacterium]
MRWIWFGVLCMPLLLQAQPPSVTSGRMISWLAFPSKHIQSPDIDIWLPNGYADSIRYAVVYMQDGQMLFDSSITWNHQSWEVDETANGLLVQGVIRPCIFVGISSKPETRYRYFFPEDPFWQLNKRQRDTVVARLVRSGRAQRGFEPGSNEFLIFMVEELRPAINRSFSVDTNRAATFCAGSSMGAMLSCYALCKYPQVFGGAACFSTHWVGVVQQDGNPFPRAILCYLKHHLPAAGNHHWYFDCGTKTLDSLYPSIQHRVDRILKKKGYAAANWVTQYADGDDHSEKAWRRRLPAALRFLLGNKPNGGP